MCMSTVERAIIMRLHHGLLNKQLECKLHSRGNPRRSVSTSHHHGTVPQRGMILQLCIFGITHIGHTRFQSPLFHCGLFHCGLFAWNHLIMSCKLTASCTASRSAVYSVFRVTNLRVGSIQGSTCSAVGAGRQPGLATGVSRLLNPCALEQTRRPSRLHASAAQSSGEEDLMEVEIKVGGMMCDGCTSRVAEALQKEAGVTRVEVSLEKSIASVEVKAPSPLEAYQMLPKLVETVKALGFEAEPHIDGL